MLHAADFRQKAIECLAGNWGKAVGTGFVAALLGAGTTVVSAGGSNNGSNTGGSGIKISDLNGVIPEEYQMMFLTILAVIGFVGVIFFIVHFIIGGAITLGYVKFNLNQIDRKPAAFADLFSGFQRFGAGFVMQLLRMVYTFLWSLLFIIPGIYAAYGYAMTPYILFENPDMTANEAITKSKELMYGNRWRLFCLEISFIGWLILCLFLTMGIGYLWLYPYMEASYAAFYREITKEKYGRTEKKEDAYDQFYYSDRNTV